MEYEQILDLYWQRDEAAIRKTERKYGRYLTKIAYSILANAEDSQESLSDAYLAKIVRLCSIDIFRRRHREKRLGGEYAI